MVSLVCCVVVLFFVVVSFFLFSAGGMGEVESHPQECREDWEAFLVGLSSGPSLGDSRPIQSFWEGSGGHPESQEGSGCLFRVPVGVRRPSWRGGRGREGTGGTSRAPGRVGSPPSRARKKGRPSWRGYFLDPPWGNPDPFQPSGRVQEAAQRAARGLVVLLRARSSREAPLKR